MWHSTGISYTQLALTRMEHIQVEGRYITLHLSGEEKIYVFDSICYHAGGLLSLGEIDHIDDIEDLVVTCPLHHYQISLEDGAKLYQGLHMVEGKLVPRGGYQKNVSRYVCVRSTLLSLEA